MGLLPSSECALVASTTHSASPIDAGSLATGEPGWLNANAFALDQRPRCDMIPIALHEAVPGHHLQRALANELPGLRAFRRDLAFPAFVEGWAIYAERLGIEMGMYATTDAEVGRLCRSLREAAAMVADTGMHGMGWSRDRAIAYLREQAELSESESRSEVDRAITWPGLACAGPIGAMKMLQLRSTAASALGEQFRLRAFHDVLLSGGAIPLPQLEDRVRHWIDAERSRGSGTGDSHFSNIMKHA